MTAPDRQPYDRTDRDDPVEGGQLVTPSDTIDLAFTSRLLYVTGAGNLTVVMADGSEIPMSVAANSYHPLRVTRVKAGGTASGIIAFW